VRAAPARLLALLVCLAALAALPASAGARASDADVRRALGQILTASGYDQSVSISVRDENGDVVYDHRGKTPRIPASNEKLTSLTAFTSPFPSRAG